MKFYDTCSLLKKVDNLFDEEEFAISSITLNELEGIKTSATKDPDVKFAARKILHLLDENPKKYQVVLYYTYMIELKSDNLFMDYVIYSDELVRRQTCQTI